MFIINRINLLNYFVAIIPLSLIMGNLVVNLNVIIICILGFIIYGKKIFLINDKKYQYLIYLFFFYLIFITSINNFPNFEINPTYKENFFKSIFFLRYLLLFLVINKLIETDQFNLKIFYYSATFFSIIISIDLIIQVIFGKNLLGYTITHNRPSSFFGEENIAGGYLQKIALFPIFLFISKIKNNFKILLIFLVFLLPIFLSGNRMPTIIFFFTVIIFFIIEKNLKIIFIAIFLTFALSFVLIKSPIGGSKLQFAIKDFALQTNDLIFKLPKLFQDNNQVIKSGYPLHFNSGIQIWKDDKIFGKGLKSFRLNCKFGKNLVCNTHPHNYFIEIMVDMGLLGLILIYSIFVISLIKFVKFYSLRKKKEDKLFLLPFLFVTFFEFFPFRSSGSFFTTSNAVLIFLFLAIFINSEKIKNFIK